MRSFEAAGCKPSINRLRKTGCSIGHASIFISDSSKNGLVHIFRSQTNYLHFPLRKLLQSVKKDRLRQKSSKEWSECGSFAVCLCQHPAEMRRINRTHTIRHQLLLVTSPFISWKRPKFLLAYNDLRFMAKSFSFTVTTQIGGKN